MELLTEHWKTVWFIHVLIVYKSSNGVYSKKKLIASDWVSFTPFLISQNIMQV